MSENRLTVLLNKKNLNKVMLFFIFVLFDFTICIAQTSIEDQLFPENKIDTIYKLYQKGRKYNDWFSLPYHLPIKKQFYPDTILVKECGNYILWKGYYKNPDSVYFVKIFKDEKSYKERRAKKIYEESGKGNSTIHSVYYKILFRNGQLGAEVYYKEGGQKIKSSVSYYANGSISSRQLPNRNYREVFFENGNRRNFSLNNILYINWYENGHVSDMTIHELETVRFYPNGNLAFYERRGVPNVSYSWDIQGKPASVFYSANYYPQWYVVPENKKMDSIKAVIEKENWMTGLVNKFDPDHIDLRYFENKKKKLLIKMNDNPQDCSLEMFDSKGRLFKIYEDIGDRRSKTSIDYLSVYNAAYSSILGNKNIDSIWKEYGYNSKKQIQDNNYFNGERFNHAPLNHLKIVDDNSLLADSIKFNAVVKHYSYTEDSVIFMKEFIEKCKFHTSLLFHRSDECYECDDPYPGRRYAYGDLYRNPDLMTYKINNVEIMPIAEMGEQLILQYEYRYYIISNEDRDYYDQSSYETTSDVFSWKEYYLLDLKTNLISSTSSLINASGKIKFVNYLKEKLTDLKIDTANIKSVLADVVIIPRFQSFDILIPPDYHYCDDESSEIDNDEHFVSIGFTELKSFLNPEHPLIKWMNSLEKEDIVINRNQDYFEKEELNEFFTYGISLKCFKNVKADTIFIFNKSKELYQRYCFNKEGQVVNKKTTYDCEEEVVYKYNVNGQLKKVRSTHIKSGCSSESDHIIDWYFDDNGNLKHMTDSSYYNKCQSEISKKYYYNYSGYTYIDAGGEKEKQLYNDTILTATVKKAPLYSWSDGGLNHDTVFYDKKIRTEPLVVLRGYDYLTYDKSGNIIKKEDVSGFYIYDFTYNTDGLITKYESITRNSGDAMNYHLQKLIVYEYDSDKRLSAMKVNYYSEHGSNEEYYTIQYK
jgi:hypothetical protein